MTDQEVIPPAPRRPPSVIRNLIPRLPERGHVKIGGLGATRTSQKGNEYQLPVKYDHFRITTLERGPDGNFVMDKALHDKLGLGDTPTEIPVRLLYDDIALNMQSRYACYNGKTLWCSGDGVTALRASKNPTDQPLPEPFQVQCPCHRQDPSYTGADRCKINGRLSVIIDGAGSIGGIWVFRTTSYNSVTGLSSSLLLLQTLTGGLLANIPLKLVIQPKRVNSPVDGKAATVYVVSLEFAGDITELQETAHKIALDRATAHVSIKNIEEEARRLLALPMPANAVLPGDEPDFIVEEYYPEQNGSMGSTVVVADAAAAPPPRPQRSDYTETPAATGDPPPYDPETGEIVEDEGTEAGPDTAEVLGRSIAAARDGVAAFRKFWAALSRAERAVINDDRAKYQDIAQKADAARKAEAELSSAPSSSPPEETSERAEIWSQESYLIETPTTQDNRISWTMLRDQMMYLVDQATTEAELAKFIADNEPRIRALREASPEYEKAVQRKFEVVRQRMAPPVAAK